MGILRFDDGIEIDTSGELRLLELYDGWYVVGEGRMIPVESEKVGMKTIESIRQNGFGKES
jgi:hypothetical protein